MILTNRLCSSINILVGPGTTCRLRARFMGGGGEGSLCSVGWGGLWAGSNMGCASWADGLAVSVCGLLGLRSSTPSCPNGVLKLMF